MENAYLSLEPSNDHERAIARIVDCVELRSKSYSIAIEEVIAVLDFTVSKSDGDFLLEYIRWRMDHPIVKQEEYQQFHSRNTGEVDEGSNVTPQAIRTVLDEGFTQTGHQINGNFTFQKVKPRILVSTS